MGFIGEKCAVTCERVFKSNLAKYGAIIWRDTLIIKTQNNICNNSVVAKFTPVAKDEISES